VRTSITDWADYDQMKAEHHPCVVANCWIEALAPRRALCAEHELAYIARHGEPSPEVNPVMWGRMLHMKEFQSHDPQG
jgi:hypothetical protein